MEWIIKFHLDFEEEFGVLKGEVQDELLAHALLLEKFGPQLGRPTVDTLYGSKHSNMKEMRFNADTGVWRVAFAFDSNRAAILLIAGNKAGTKGKKFYKDLLKKADERFSKHLTQLKEQSLWPIH